MRSRHLFNISAAIEVLTGLALLVAPSLVIEMLIGPGLGQVGIAVARVLGLVMLSFGISTSELSPTQTNLAPRIGLCFYNVAVAVLLVLFGTMDGLSAPLLWPACGLHMLLGVGMLSAVLTRRSRT